MTVKDEIAKIPFYKKMFICFGHFNLFRKVKKLDKASIVLYNLGEYELVFQVQKVSLKIWAEIYGIDNE